MSDDVRALTVRQPWAALIAAGIKPVENRSWSLPAGFGGPLLIHAGLRDDADGWRSLRAGRSLRAAGSGTVGGSAAVREALEGVEVVYGAVVAVAGKVTCHRDTGCCADLWGEPGAWHWLLEELTALPEPIPAPGHQGLWRPEPDVTSAALAGPQGVG
ncbi:hypothetical protein AB0H69_00260 [Streptomyces phaeochromogenes]|uniref:hypothetical protein n=1 Tax=Streptomyces phaeochromogenes TaxID=1923 RepID=UPI0033CB7891